MGRPSPSFRRVLRRASGEAILERAGTGVETPPAVASVPLRLRGRLAVGVVVSCHGVEVAQKPTHDGGECHLVGFSGRLEAFV